MRQRQRESERARENTGANFLPLVHFELRRRLRRVQPPPPPPRCRRSFAASGLPIPLSAVYDGVERGRAGKAASLGFRKGLNLINSTEHSVELSVCGLTSAFPPPFTDDSTNESDFHATLCFPDSLLSEAASSYPPGGGGGVARHPPMDIRSRTLFA